ncbi:MAG: hypothetical protein JSS28_08770 [Proteobacteria bacterium]|nr:hypothetical protein [Pseudomonadota bacterium]
MNKATRNHAAESFQELADRLTRMYGVVVGGATLTRVLGYPTQAAFRQACARKHLPVPVFTIEGRRGRFAQVGDIACWLLSQRGAASTPPRRAENKEDKAMTG